MRDIEHSLLKEVFIGSVVARRWRNFDFGCNTYVHTDKTVSLK